MRLTSAFQLEKIEPRPVARGRVTGCEAPCVCEVAVVDRNRSRSSSTKQLLDFKHEAGAAARCSLVACCREPEAAGSLVQHPGPCATVQRGAAAPSTCRTTSADPPCHP
eukprot:2061219-Rhodomonas_salina.2